MQRVYLLLRNNRESGPHSADDLEKMGLKPFDLIWVEGMSQAWCYPSDVAALKHLVPGVPVQPQVNLAEPPQVAPPPKPAPVPVQKPASAHIFVSLPQGKNPLNPADDIEARAEALRRRMESVTPASTLQTSEPQSTTHYQRSMNEVSEEYGSWLLNAKAKKKKSFSIRHLAGAVVILIGLAAGWRIGRMVYSSPSLTLSQQSAQTAKKSVGKQKRIAEASLTDLKIGKEQSKPDSVRQTATEPALVEKTKTNVEKKAKTTAIKPLVVPVHDSEAVAAIPATEEPKQAEVKEPVVQNPQPAAGEPKKKKGFFASLFGKKNKEGEGEVKTPVDISNKISLRLKEDPEAWMMGVQGAKLILRNESNAELKQAAIEISYYNDQNSVLDKKTVAVGSVGSGKSKTVSIPDHRTASRVSYQLLSATAEE